MSGVWCRRLNSYLICRTNLICRFVRCPACHGVSCRKDEANSMPERTAGRDNWSKIWNTVVSTNVPCRHSEVCRMLRCYLLSDANRIIIYSCVALGHSLYVILCMTCIYYRTEMSPKNSLSSCPWFSVTSCSQRQKSMKKRRIFLSSCVIRSGKNENCSRRSRSPSKFFCFRLLT